MIGNIKKLIRLFTRAGEKIEFTVRAYPSTQSVHIVFHTHSNRTVLSLSQSGALKLAEELKYEAGKLNQEDGDLHPMNNFGLPKATEEVE